MRACPPAVEFGLMSTTTDRATAAAYSGVAKNRGIVLEIAVGEVDKGASISFLSQYPAEAEYLMPPLSCLEVPLLRPRRPLSRSRIGLWPFSAREAAGH